MGRFIASENIPVLLTRLATDGAVWAPAELPDSGESVVFAPWQPGREVVLDRFTQMSPKELVLPMSERLLSFSYTLTMEGEEMEVESAIPGGHTVIFGARACDAKALVVLDALFHQDPETTWSDTQYRARRDDMTVVTIACVKGTADAACFCSSWENGTAEKAGSDVIIYPVPGGFLAEAVTIRGTEVTGWDMFDDSDQPLPELDTTDVVDFDGLVEKLVTPGVFSDLDFWGRESHKCISCGYCTYGCPTCYCFNIYDEMQGDRQGERCRSWDACMFYNYTVETSGHNPRPTIAHRWRNRLGHKFSYYPANQGETLCTGCGRCIRGCPTGVDIRDILRAAGEHE
ncbi:MAG: hydrogenase [Gaiellales bacterium]|nr:MAG: hydrogenase [Gaiellales bacterium]